MASLSMIENLIIKAKESTQGDIITLCSAAADLLSIPEKIAECCGLLRQLFVILQAIDSEAIEASLPVSMLQKMVQAVITAPQNIKSLGVVGKCTLCQMILSDLYPNESLDNFMSSQHTSGIVSNPTFLSSIMGKRSKCFGNMSQDFVRWLQGQDFEAQKAGLVALTTLNLLHGKIVEENLLTASSKRIAQWLSSTSLLQAPNPHTINPFRKDEESEVTEIDGSVNTNIFTALNIGQYYTDDQIMNIYSFSVLYQWLLFQFERGEDTVSSPSLSDCKKDVSSINQHVVAMLVPKSVDYCFRVIDQSERKVKIQSDLEIQTACLLEAVRLLDIICFLDHNQTARVFQEIKRLNSRLIESNSQLPALVPVLQFFFHHSKSVVHDPQQTFSHFFSTIVSANFKDQGLMYDTVDFLYSNQSDVAHTSDIFIKFFPNLFKILAWHPRVFLKEYSSLLPSMLNWDTAIEIYHLLLDLPCATAALEVMDGAKNLEQLNTSIDIEPSSSTEAFGSPKFRPLFSYITRSESGQGDTINRLASLHNVLRDCMQSTRVLVSCQLVPVLLKVWFETVITCDDSSFVAHLIPVILERSGIIFGIPELITDIHKVMADQILSLCKKYPEVVTIQQDEIIEFLHSTSNMAGRVLFYSSLIYVVGEYSSPAYCPGCTSDVIGRYYEVLEAVTYELVVQLGSDNMDSSVPKVVSTLISAVAKLASRCQDLIPRAIISLTKIAKPHGLLTVPTITKDILVNKAKSLIAVLKNPDSATILLNPGIEIYSERWHLNNISRPTVLRGMCRLMNE